MNPISPFSFSGHFRSMKARFTMTALIFVVCTSGAMSAGKKEAARGEGRPPSEQLDPLLGRCLDAIAAPLNKSPKLPSVDVEKLRSSLAAGQLTADSPHQKEIYQNAMAVCDVLTKGMDERVAEEAAALAAGKTPTLTTGGGIIKTSPIRGRDAGANAEAIRKKQRDERKYADKEAGTSATFVESAAIKMWTDKATRIRQNTMALFTRQKQLEAYEEKEEKAIAGEQKPSGISVKKPFSYTGTWISSSGRKYIVNDDHTLVRVPKKGPNVKGKWKVDDNGFFHIDCEDKSHFDGKPCDDGTIDFPANTKWTRE